MQNMDQAKFLAEQLSLQRWEVMGVWLSGFGTIAAVIVALWLARGKGRVKLSVTAGHRVLITRGKKDMPDYCGIRVVNTGLRLARITSVSWEIGRFRKSRTSLLQMLDFPGFETVPKDLQEGQDVMFVIPFRAYGDEHDWIRTFTQRVFENRNPEKAAKQVKVVVNVSTGQVFKAKIEEPLQKLLLEEYKKNMEGSPNNGMGSAARRGT